ncbi:dienelactone hydrolase [Litoreibacter ponti]|uniref:Dienelactone hydrolase n=1 Tax=Litoreibacter ponti TaxID=1510457 RepID=A0A2T6BHA8_9RHOB|nr:dienelactone hydrolase family protein [Litoreibacter ponti]PTX55437.1 dienelactone hydrolase [Litoreibacter ponti]
MMEELRYTADVECVGTVFRPAGDGPRPVVLVAPAFGGVGPFSKSKAGYIASLGYIGVEVDYYGGGWRTDDRDAASAKMGELQADRPALGARMVAALKAARGLEGADPGRVAAIGFCLGGKAVLDLARSGEPLAGVVPIHGLFDAPEGGSAKMNTSVLALHGWDDPLATPDAVLALSQELNAVCDDWQMLAFGNTGHSFTNPAAQSPEDGMAYSAQADARAFAALEAFLVERFAKTA